MSDVRIVVDDAAIAALGRDPRVQALLGDAGRDLTRVAAAAAPRDTGAGAASIGPQLLPGEVRVSWDRPHDYMRFQDLGTRYVTGSHFLEHALDALDYLDYAHL